MSKPQALFKREDVALVLIDYQPEMFANIRSETSSDLIDLNVRLLIKAAKAFDIPVILSTVGVKYGVNHPTRQSIVDELPGVTAIDRTSMNAWEDEAFRAAVEATGRKKLIFGALYTEICLAFPVLEAMADGYDATFVVDAVGGMSQLAHRTAVERLTNAGAAPTTAIAIVTELFRDWASPVADKARTILKDYAGNLVAWAGR
jgi:nicotinamidase-related amidase